MPWIDTVDLTEESPYSPMETYWLYNGLDATITYEVHEALAKQTSPEVERVYHFERAMQWPAMDMMLRGFRIDPYWRMENIDATQKDLTNYELRLNALAQIVQGSPLNARSPLQLKKFFTEGLRIPIPVTRIKGEEKESLGRKVLEKIFEQYLYSRPFISHILAIRGASKTLGVLRSGVDSDSRIRTSYNIAGTETGRWSSSENAFGTGTNLQNVTEKLRRMMIADPGYKLFYIDLEQAESRAVALLLYHEFTGQWAWCVAFGFPIPKYCYNRAAYWDACESGDLHTTVAMMTWPELGWTDDLKLNKAKADDSSRPFYRDFTYRDISKRVGHGSNYFGSPFGIAAQIGKIETSVVKSFQDKYLPAFSMSEWHQSVIAKVQVNGYLTTPLGRTRQFFGRVGDPATHREAIANSPQSMVGDILNRGLWNIWNHYRSVSRGLGDLNAPVQLLGQIHDAVVGQYRDISPEFEARTLAKIQELLSVPVTVCDRTMVIPSDIKIGWNFSKVDYDKKQFKDGNPDGLTGYKGQGNDTRKRAKALEILDRYVR